MITEREVEAALAAWGKEFEGPWEDHMRITLAAAEAARWQTMDTAPRDGTDVLGSCDWEELYVVARWSDGRWTAQWDGSPIGPELEITHWQPLPAPPEAAK